MELKVKASRTFRLTRSDHDVKYLTADSLQLMNQIFSLVGREMSDVNSFVHRAHPLTSNLLSQ